MNLARTRILLEDQLNPVRQRGSRIGLVPTMGFLHEGHLSLVDLARRESDYVAVSIFVNPLQFGPREDLARYPRDLDRDLELLEGRGADLVFHPSVGEMYPGGEPEVFVAPGPMGDGLCGRHRPGHFRGVLTVVARLFGLVRPHLATFGQKDFQQAALIRRMVLDLEFGVEVLTGPIVREKDGLALSSRNVFLSPEERRDAVGLYRGLMAVQDSFRSGERSPLALRRTLEDTVTRYPRLRLQYAEIVGPDRLEPVAQAQEGSVVALAAHCGSTRLIDNHHLEG